MANIPFSTVPYPPMEPPAHREKKMKVLALGMSRTGTMCGRIPFLGPIENMRANNK